jgi:hypothetical protein
VYCERPAQGDVARKAEKKKKEKEQGKEQGKKIIRRTYPGNSLVHRQHSHAL